MGRMLHGKFFVLEDSLLDKKEPCVSLPTRHYESREFRRLDKGDFMKAIRSYREH